MKILLNKDDLNEALSNTSKLGFVPTMGSLHEGHISLINKSLKYCNKTIVSIFINPTQFNSRKDFNKYPRNYKKDLSILRKMKVDYVFLPNKKDVYSPIRKIPIKLKKQEKILCAKYRKGHFEGVIDVMERLTKIIRPEKIFMGEKDFQQLFLVKKYIEKKYRSKIVSCRTVRNSKKLALSSRNKLLNGKELNRAAKVAIDIINFKKKIKNQKNIKRLMEIKKKQLGKLYRINIEYFELRNTINLNFSNGIKNSKLFIAYYINKIRLIDNF